jgi:Uma2 family endonuclease
MFANHLATFFRPPSPKSKHQGIIMSEKILSQQEKNYTADEYLKMERRQANKHEFSNGKILATAGSTRRHNLICTNTIVAVGSRLRGHKNELYANDMRVRLNPNRFCYPDVIVVSGDPVFADRETDVLLNPTVVIEILSSPNGQNDKTDKLESYLAMDSIRECVLIREDDMRVEHYSKQNAKQWIFRIYNDREDVLTLDSINCKVSLAEIYSQVRSGQAEVNTQSVNSQSATQAVN